MSVVMGIDPGQNGGVAFIGPRSYQAWMMPLVGKEVDTSMLYRWIVSWKPTLAVVERQQAFPGQGVTSMFSHGVHYGTLLGALRAWGVPTMTPTPQQWKKRVLEGTAKDKEAALAFAARRYPEAELIPPGCRKPRDGMADALCIAHYGLSL